MEQIIKFKDFIKEDKFPEKISEFINNYKERPFLLFTEYIKESPDWKNKDCHFGQEGLQKMLGNDD
jgi:hypothetical protein